MKNKTGFEDNATAENLREETLRLRMKGITQSYFVYDSIDYKPLRPLIESIKTDHEDEKHGFRNRKRSLGSLELISMNTENI